MLPTRALPVRPTPCPPGLAPCFATGEYADPLSTLILAHKERSVFALARPLGGLLAVAAGAAIRPGAGPVLLVPVPSRRSVVRARGHDPLLRVTRVAATRLRVAGHRPQVVELLEQRLQRADQAGLDTEARAVNLVDTLAVRARTRAVLARSTQLLTVLLCDDVITTGATAREAQRALEESGIGVCAVVTVAATRKEHTRLPFWPPPH